jgi:lantibiotic modifying enzyme
MNSDNFHGLVDRATFLHERLGGTWQPTPHPFDAERVERRLDRWCQLTAGGDWNRFAQRLSWDGLDLVTVRRLLGTGRHAPGTPLPEWANFLAQVIDFAADQPAAEIAPFFADAAQNRLAQRAGQKLAWLAPIARQSLSAYLAERLRLLSHATLADAQAQTVAIHFLRYPVLARQLAQRCLDWVAEVEDFLFRLGEDWPALAQHVDLPPSPTAGIVRDLLPGLSDPHRGGRTVWRVDLGGGSVAYKPKDLQMDQSWAELVQWTEAKGLETGPGRLWILPRRGYGWMEWAQPGPALDPRRLAQNFGSMLALLHLVHAADCHAENLAVRGNSPLLLDGEMLVYPHFTGHEDADPLDVVRTGLLPRWTVDQIELPGVRSLFQETLSPVDVIDGYRIACDFLLSVWTELADESGVLARLRRGQVRIAPRPTAAYLRLLDHLRHPAFLTDAIDFSIETDRLAHAYLHRPDQARFVPLLGTEHRAIAQGDLPLFYGQIDHPELFHTQGALPDTRKNRQEIGGAGVPSLRWLPFSLPSPVDKAQQAALIHAGLDRSSYAAGMPPTFIAAACFLGDLLAQRAVPLEAIGAIERGFGGLSGSMQISRDLDFNPSDPPNPLNPRSISAITWTAIQFQPRSGLWQHGLVGEDLYAGRAGIALFLAALAHVTGEARWRDLALAGLTAKATSADDLGGRIYALSVAAQLLREPSLLAQPERLARQLPPVDTVSQGNAYPWGVLDGEAGIVLALLGLYERSAEATVLALAAARGHEILHAAAAWTDPQRGLGGFSHGAAGIAYTLWRLHRATGDGQFLAGAMQAWDFQQNLYTDPPGNWQDRRGQTPVYLRNWCNGAAGIGLAGAACADDLPHLRPIVERSAELLIEDHSSDLDTLCCGQFGQIESLLEMGQLQNRQDWIEAASAQARQALARAAKAGAFRLYDDLPDNLFNPGFFRGAAGIGYTLLRLAVVNGEAVGELPCVGRM